MKSKQIAFVDQTQAAIQKGVDAVYAVAAAAYGAKGGNVLLERQYGDPSLSRDGVTNVREVFLADRIENMAARVVVQASQKSNESVGDGTTGAVILTKHLLDAARKLVASGANDRMVVTSKLEAIIPDVLKKLDKISKKVDDEKILQVATVSAGDEAIGALIAESIKAVGVDGGVVVERHAGLGIYNELQDGFYFNKGFLNPWLVNNRAQMRSEHNDAHILITEKTFGGLMEIAHIMDVCFNNGIKQITIIGNVVGEALQCVVANHVQGRFDMSVVEPPASMSGQKLFLEDLATVTGGKVFTEGMSHESFDIDMLGTADKVMVGEFNTSIIGGKGSGEDVEVLVKTLKEQLTAADDPRTVEAIQERLGKLTGKVCVIKVGGATPTDADFTKLRVDDAVCAVRSAMRSGVVPGGGIALMRCRKEAGEFGDAMTQPFLQLFSNAGVNAERLLGKVEDAPTWKGFDLKNISDAPTDLLEAGIVDPLEVIKEVVVNAVTTAAKLISTTAAIVSEDEPANNTDNK